MKWTAEADASLLCAIFNVTNIKLDHANYIAIAEEVSKSQNTKLTAVAIQLRVHKLRHVHDKKKPKGNGDEGDGGKTASEAGTPKKKRKTKKQVLEEGGKEIDFADFLS